MMDTSSIAHGRIEEELINNGTCATNTVGVSMRPLLRTNDAVFLVAPDRDIKKYDVVLYPGSSNKYILHRVIGFKGTTHFIIRGDNTYIKEYVLRERVIAYLASFTRKGKNHKVTELRYKLYSRFWNFIYPLRLLWRKFRSLAGRIVRKIIK